jgi:hypothetical protein
MKSDLRRSKGQFTVLGVAIKTNAYLGTKSGLISRTRLCNLLFALFLFTALPTLAWEFSQFAIAESGFFNF